LLVAGRTRLNEAVVLDSSYVPPETLPPLVRGLLTTTRERHVDMANLVAGLPAGALEWQPFDDAASLAGLALHILDVEEYLAALANGAAVEWTGENGSRMQERATEAELLAEIERIDSLLISALGSVDAERLGALQPGESRTVGEALVEDLDHSAMHYGHMQLTRHSWEAAHPDAAPTYSHWR
jgi:hypothetical protein